MMTAALTLALLAAPVLVRATEGLSGAEVGATSSGNEGGRHARFEKWCEENQEKCQAVRARREQCRANPEQCRAERQARFAERFKKADTDGDGTLSRAEAEKGMPRLSRHFDAIDADKDGHVTRDEIEAARKARASRRTKPRES
jgi:hypothetical protein